MKNELKENVVQNEKQVKIYRNLMFDFRICRGTVKKLEKKIPVKIMEKKYNTEELDALKEKK